MTNQFTATATRATLEKNSARQINSIVFDATGRITSESLNVERNDRILLVDERLTLSDLMVTEAWLADRCGAVLFVQPADDGMSLMCTRLLFEYAAQKVIAQRLLEVEIYPADLTPGPFMQLLASTTQSAVQVIKSLRS